MLKLIITFCILAVAFGRDIPRNARRFHTAPASKSGSPSQQSLGTVPSNVAEYAGQSVLLECSGVYNVETSQNYRIVWWEYVTVSTGSPISDGNYVLPGHTNAARYRIDQPTNDTFNLVISDLQLADGGTYACEDQYGSGSQVSKWKAELIVISTTPNCSTSIPADGVILEGQYHQAQCLVYYAGNIHPIMTSEGVQPYRFVSSNTSTSVWGAIDFNASRSMDTAVFKIRTQFDGYFLPVPENSSAVIPAYNYLYQTQQIFVYWGPKEMYVNGVKPVNEVGDLITCYADAFPTPSYSWQNLETLQTINSQGFNVPESFEGKTQRMRCTAQNVIQGFPYSNDTVVNITVAAKTTTQPTTALPTTTTPPAVSDCFDLTGHWESTNIKATLCLRVNETVNGLTYGFLRNGTDTFFTEMYGRTDDRDAQVGVAGVFPPRLTFGVVSLVGECHRCYGVEQLFVNAVSRYYGGACAGVGDVYYSGDYIFSRTSFDFDCMS